MAGAFRLALDTHAPVVTWGAIGGGDAGGLLQVAYTVDEPALDSAVLRLRDGRVLAMSVLADHIEVVLPYDAPNGYSTITAVAVDDLDNLASYTLDVPITGGVGTIPTPLFDRGTAPMPTGPSRRTSERQERRIDSRSRARTSSTTRVAARRRDHTTVVARSTDAVRSRSADHSRALATSRVRAIAGHGHRHPPGATGSRIEVIRRRDGQEIEALLLDLL